MKSKAFLKHFAHDYRFVRGDSVFLIFLNSVDSCNPLQNILGKIKKPSQVRQYRKTLTSAFVDF